MTPKAIFLASQPVLFPPGFDQEKYGSARVGNSASKGRQRSGVMNQGHPNKILPAPVVFMITARPAIKTTLSIPKPRLKNRSLFSQVPGFASFSRENPRPAVKPFRPVHTKNQKKRSAKLHEKRKSQKMRFSHKTPGLRIDGLSVLPRPHEKQDVRNRRLPETQEGCAP